MERAAGLRAALNEAFKTEDKIQIQLRQDSFFVNKIRLKFNIANYIVYKSVIERVPRPADRDRDLLPRPRPRTSSSGSSSFCPAGTWPRDIRSNGPTEDLAGRILSQHPVEEDPGGGAHRHQRKKRHPDLHPGRLSSQGPLRKPETVHEHPPDPALDPVADQPSHVARSVPDRADQHQELPGIHPQSFGQRLHPVPGPRPAPGVDPARTDPAGHQRLPPRRREIRNPQRDPRQAGQARAGRTGGHGNGIPTSGRESSPGARTTEEIPDAAIQVAMEHHIKPGMAGYPKYARRKR